MSSPGIFKNKSIKMAVFWDAAPSSLVETDVSKTPAASMIGANVAAEDCVLQDVTQYHS
jgi:hypothetical protein